jgi:hypothetical protein
LQSFSNDTRDLLNNAGFDFNNMSSNLIKQVGSTVEKVSKAEGDTSG